MKSEKAPSTKCDTVCLTLAVCYPQCVLGSLLLDFPSMQHPVNPKLGHIFSWVGR